MIEEYEAKLLSVVGIASRFKMAHLPIAVCHHDSFKGCHGSLFIPLLYLPGRRPHQLLKDSLARIHGDEFG